MIRRNWIARLLTAALGVAAIAAPVSAGLLPVSVSVQPEAGNFRWTYSVVLPTDMKMQSGSYFTIYDFGGYVPNTGGVTATSPDGSYIGYWSLTADNVGPTPDRLNPQDDPGTTNLTWTYNGPTIPAGQMTLGNFSATSTQEGSQTSFFTATNPRAVGGEIDNNITQTITPLSTTTEAPPGVPEPTTLALAGLGLPILGAARWFRRNKK